MRCQRLNHGVGPGRATDVGGTCTYAKPESQLSYHWQCTFSCSILSSVDALTPRQRSADSELGRRTAAGPGNPCQWRPVGRVPLPVISEPSLAGSAAADLEIRVIRVRHWPAYRYTCVRWLYYYHRSRCALALALDSELPVALPPPRRSLPASLSLSLRESTLEHTKAMVKVSLPVTTGLPH